MKFVVDENIPFGKDVFSLAGDVVTLPGRSMTQADLMDADALLVRSVTRVDENLLAGTPVRFVGTATIGEDHIDKTYLHEAGIAFSSAQGCNANSVSEWFTCAVLHVVNALSLSLPDLTLGIVGVGNVGRQVLGKARALGMRVLLNDPPRQETDGAHTGFPLADGDSLPFTSLDTLLEKADIVTVHVPLTRTGEHPTWKLFNASRFAAMKPTAVFINASRGDVHDESAIRNALSARLIRAAVLDVWENEPAVSRETLAGVLIGTPHIAGYSFDGKINGTKMIFDACMAHFGLDHTWDASIIPPPVYPELVTNVMNNESMYDVIRRVTGVLYPLANDDMRLRAAINDAPADAVGKRVDLLRKHYPIRREWHHTTLKISGARPDTSAIFRGLGFQVG